MDDVSYYMPRDPMCDELIEYIEKHKGIQWHISGYQQALLVGYIKDFFDDRVEVKK